MHNLPMGQDNLHIHIPPQNDLGFIRVRRQIHQMSDQSRHPGTVDTALCENPTNNRILVAIWDIPTGENHIVKEKSRVWAVLAGVGHFVLRQGRMQPLRLYDGDQSIVRSIVCWKVNGIADKVGELLQGWE